MVNGIGHVAFNVKDMEKTVHSLNMLEKIKYLNKKI